MTVSLSPAGRAHHPAAPPSREPPPRSGGQLPDAGAAACITITTSIPARIFWPPDWRQSQPWGSCHGNGLVRRALTKRAMALSCPSSTCGRLVLVLLGLSSAQQPAKLNALGAKSGCHLTGAYFAMVKPPALAGNGRRGPGVRAEPEPLIRLWELMGVRPGRLGPAEGRPGAMPRAGAEGTAGLGAWIGTAAAAKCNRKEAPRPQPSRPQPCSSRSIRGLAAGLAPPAGLLNSNLVASEQSQRREAFDDVMLTLRINQCVVTIATAPVTRVPPAANTPLKGGGPFKGRGGL